MEMSVFVNWIGFVLDWRCGGAEVCRKVYGR